MSELRIEISTRAERDLRKMTPAARRRVREGLGALAIGAANIDVKQLKGRAPWQRLRVGDHRVLYRPLTRNEAKVGDGILVARVVDRRELHRAVANLSE